MEVVVGSDDDSDSATQIMTPDQLRAKLASEMEAPSVKPKPSKTAHSSSKSSTRTLEIVLPSGQEITEIVSSEMHTAALISFMMGRVLPLPFEQSGNLKSWYRFEQGGKRVSPTLKVSDLASSPLHVVSVMGDTRMVEIAVLSNKGQDVRFTNPVSTVIPISSLTSHLQQWLALPAAEWELVVDGTVLDPHMILDDVIDEGALSVQLRIAAS